MSQPHLRFRWMPIVLHFLVANALSWLIQISRELSTTMVRISESVSLIVPSISGYSAMAANPSWAASYLLICWLGVPLYFRFFWRLSETVLPTWVAAQNAFRFWLVCLVNIICAAVLLTLPSTHTHLSDATESVRATALVVSLMKEYSFVFSAATLMVVLVFSFISAAASKAIQLRIECPTPNLKDRSNK